ncbi:DUF167 domain-containing protein [Andreprevotia chitinilytica]|uniref:DUF167 domain-containing protein n=1 Tax=Andreprevotia chitinilytica TaxID=396808 RepID=UPI0005515405|nr:DUF167 family protein [Andreprevotia chitinilytica]
MAAWFEARPDGWLLRLHIQPGAKKTEIAGLHGEALKIRLAAPPVDGKANECLIEFLAKRFAVPKRQVTLVSGAASRTKAVLITGSSTAPDSLLAL